ncbi:MAG: alpha-2-macroglobulin, partial [Acidimicrobiia bacterium]
MRTRQNPRARRSLGALLAAALLAGCIGGGDEQDAAPSATTAGARQLTNDDPGTRMKLRLSTGSALDTGRLPLAVQDGTPLDQAAIDAITDRLPAWTPATDAEPTVSWPTETLPRPRAGRTIDTPLGVSTGGSAPTTTPAALAVQRVQPSGDVAIAPFVSITFNQPMVPLATLAQLDAEDVPATIEPRIDGRWQWLGTQLLRFDAAPSDRSVPGAPDRLPMATELTVTVPAGTRAASGAELAQATSFRFRTPAPSVQSFQPTGVDLALDAVFVASFDQLVDPAEVVRAITVTADDRAQAIRVATPAEIEAAEAVDTSALLAGRWVAFRTVDPLPADAAVRVTVGPDVPSAEGPLRSTEPETYTLRTYPPLTLRSAGCGDGGACAPSSPLVLRFSNPLDADRFDPASITVTPTLDGQRVRVEHDTVVINGATAARTAYTVTVAAGLRDERGQELAEEVSKEVTIGPAQMTLGAWPNLLTTLDPFAATPSLDIVTTNHPSVRVRTYEVAPSDWEAFFLYAMSVTQPFPGAVPATPPGTLRRDEVVTITGEQDRSVRTALDLSAEIGPDGIGHVAVIVEPTIPVDPQSREAWLNRPAATWVQATGIGLDAFRDNDEVHAWATDLRTGQPLADVSVALSRSGPVVTGADGTAVVALSGFDPSTSPAGGAAALVATRGADSALLGPGYWLPYPVAAEGRWYVFDDRGTYRPGETVSVKGWLRRFDAGGDALLHLVGEGQVGYQLLDGAGVRLAEGTTTLSPLGGFDLSLALPAGANLGQATLLLSADVAGVGMTNGYHGFTVAEYRRPEFEVTARLESAEPVLSTATATLAADAAYYAGGALAGAPVTWQVRTSPGSYAPPGWDRYTFGVWTPWWLAGGALGRGGWGGPIDPSGEQRWETYRGTTDLDGRHHLAVDFAGDDGGLPDLPQVLVAQASVEDVNRQALAGSTTVLVHPAELYVGLRSDRTFVAAGEPLVVDAVLTGIDGAAVPGRPFTVTAHRVEWANRNGTWTEDLVDEQTCEVTSAAESARCTFDTAIGGTYRIGATVQDGKGGANRSELTRWVSGGGSVAARTLQRQDLTVVPDASLYNPGDTATILVQAPFAEGYGIVTVSRVGIEASHQFVVTDGAAEVPLPIAERDVPGVHLSFEVVGATDRTDATGTVLVGTPPRPAFATAELDLPVSTASRTLTVAATPRQSTLLPGGATQLDLQVTGPDGDPVAGAELAVVVVDEAVLALSGHRLPDPHTLLTTAGYGTQPPQLGRDTIILADLGAAASGEGSVDEGLGGVPTTAAAVAESAGDAARSVDPAVKAGVADAAFNAAPGSPAAPIVLRSDFNPLAVFRPAVATDAAGRATVDVPLPDNVTRYRVMVVAAAGEDRFGTAEASITARLPLTVRPAAPRFLNHGDRFELPVVLQNQTDAAMTVDVVVQAANLTLLEGAGRRVRVPADERIEVRFPVRTANAGPASLRIAAVSGGDADAAIVELPVHTPATTEAFATYGVLPEGAVEQPFRTPSDVIDGFGGLDVTLSSTALQGLTDAVLDVVRYPYDTADGRAARILTIAALRDVLDQFAAPDVPTAAEALATIDADVAALVALQNADGGFTHWEPGRPSEAFVSIVVTDALVAARTAGATVPAGMLDAALGYLATIESTYPTELTEPVRDVLSAYALHVRSKAGGRDAAKARALWERRGAELSLEAAAWIWPVLDDPAAVAAIDSRITNAAVETADAATFTVAYGEDAHLVLSSERRVDAVVLDALITMRPDSTLIPKVVTGLLAQRRDGRWSGVQEHTVIIGALRRYFDVYEAQDPAFVARVWLEDRYAGEQSFAGRSTDRTRLTLPMTDLVEAGDGSVTVAKDGTGRLYYRLGLRYAPTDLRVDPLDRGFVVARSYEAVDDPADVRLD